MKNIMRFKFVKRIILLSCVFIFSIANFIFALTYDISQINQVKAITEYSIDTKIEQMDTVTFGSYPQSDINGATKEPIEWIVLEKRGNKALLLSKYILDICSKIGVNTDTNNKYWKKYLNNTLYKAAFNSSHSGLIENNEVVILSKEDVLKYFIYDSERLDYTGRSDGIYLKRKAFSSSSTDYYVEKYKDLNNQNIWLPIWSLSDVDNKNGRGNYAVGGGGRSYIPNIGAGKRDQDLFYCRPAIWVNINSINNSKTKSILGDNVNIEGIDVWQNQDGTIQIGGTQEAGAKLIQSGSSNDGRIAGLPSRESELRSDDHFYLDDSMQRNTWVYYVTYYYHVDGKGNIEKSKWITGAIVNSNGDTMTVKRYVGEDGRMYRGRQTPDGKWVGNDGLLVDVGNDLSTSLTIEAAEPDSWYKTQSGLWYYFENDRTTTKKGWFTDTRDNQTYYLNPQTGIMAIGWTKISGNEYYFNELQAEEQNWYETGGGFYESYGKKIKALGSMYKNETTPDGKKVDANGKLIK